MFGFHSFVSLANQMLINAYAWTMVKDKFYYSCCYTFSILVGLIISLELDFVHIILDLEMVPESVRVCVF